MSPTTVLGITVLGHHRVNRSLRTSANLDFANRNCFDLLVKIIVTAPIARGSSLKSPLDADVVSPLAVLAKIPVRAGKPPRQRAIAQRFRALALLDRHPLIEFPVPIGGTADMDGAAASADRDAHDPELPSAARQLRNALLLLSRAKP